MLPSCCFGQLGGRRRSCFAYIDSELKMQSLSQRAWRFVFFSPRVYLALQHPRFSIFTSKVFLPCNHTDGWILYFPSYFMSILSSSSTRSTSGVISHVWQNDIVGLFSDTPPPDYLPPSAGMFGGETATSVTSTLEILRTWGGNEVQIAFIIVCGLWHEMSQSSALRLLHPKKKKKRRRERKWTKHIPRLNTELSQNVLKEFQLTLE